MPRIDALDRRIGLDRRTGCDRRGQQIGTQAIAIAIVDRREAPAAGGAGEGLEGSSRNRTAGSRSAQPNGAGTTRPGG